MTEPVCRCGWTGEGDHLCHRCHAQPGTRRFYVPHWQFALAGVQMKASARDTVACDPCWEWFSAELEKAKAAKAKKP